MKKIIIVSVIVLLLTWFIWAVIVPQDWKNRAERLKVEHLSGSYHVTTSIDTLVVEWDVDGKITSEPEKGYYFFTDVNGKYVQTPIRSTFFEGR